MTRNRLKPPHEYVSRNGPSNWNGGNNLIRIIIDCDSSGAEVPLKLLFDIYYEFGGIYENYKHNMFFTIPDDCWVEMSLGQSCKGIVDWADGLLPWTGKRNHDSHYGSISFDETTKVLRFKAKAKRGNPDKHGFNLNLAINQGTGTNPETGQTGQQLPPLPVTFDPDVINPRPPGFYAADSNAVFKAIVKGVDGSDIEEYFLRSEYLSEA